MAVYRVAVAARVDIADVLRYSEAKFGPAARRRYTLLINAAFQSIAEQPERIGSYARDEIAPGLRSLHLRYCRGHSAQDQIGRPRHIVFYRIRADRVIEIVRLLHEAMELDRYFPD